MLNKLIYFSLHNRLLVLATAALLVVGGAIVALNLPIDVLPDLNRPRVTIFLEANGLAPEELETQVILPVETALNGAPGVEVVRSSAAIGLGMVFVEFDWETDIYRARQLVAEKIQTVNLPKGIIPVMGPISSIMGQIMAIGISSSNGKTGPAELRTLADFTIRRRLLSIRGVAQVIPMGGERLQYQVLVSAEKLRRFNLSINDVDRALEASNQNTTGNFFNQRGMEVLIRNVSRTTSLDELGKTVIANSNNRPVLLSQVAELNFGAAIKRGDASVNGLPAVILTVEKQPGANTVGLTDEVEKALKEIQAGLPADVQVNPFIFQQKSFIVTSIANVQEALRDGFILVVIVLFLFLLNFRTTVITLTAIPLSLVITALVFKWFDISINTLTLGGLAVAIGELVDDAIVDVENVFRRLRENAAAADPKPTLQVVYEASAEVRNSIVYATVIVVLVFLPLFYLQGIEGRIFAPLGIAYITSILASLVVSLTVTPVLCSYLLDRKIKKEASDSPLVRLLKRQDVKLLHWSLARPTLILAMASLLIIASVSIIPFFGSEFLPQFNEGSYTINLNAPAGTSLEESNKLGTIAERLIMEVPEVQYVSRRTGRAELDEHVEAVSYSEVDVTLKPDGERKKNEILADIRNKLSVMKGMSMSGLN